MLKQQVAQAVIETALKTGGDFAEIFLEDRRNNNMMMLSGKVEMANQNRLHGAGVRVFSGTRSVYVHTNDTSEQGLIACAKRAAAAINGKSDYQAQQLAASVCENVHIIKELPSQACARWKKCAPPRA